MPLAAAVKVTLVPTKTVCALGVASKTGGVLTVRVAAELSVELTKLVATTV